MSYNLTLKGQLEILTSGQGHDLTGKRHVAYQSTRNVEPNTWRTLGREMWEAAGVGPPIDPVSQASVPPWEVKSGVTISLDVGPLPLNATSTQKRDAATCHLGSLPQCATWVWSDGSVEGGITNGGAGVFIEDPDGQQHLLTVPAGNVCSSYRAEMVALREALKFLLDRQTLPPELIVICTDSQSALAALRGGPSTQTTLIGGEIWAALQQLSARGRRTYLQWVPSHCGLPGNERADELAKQASALDKEEVPVDAMTVYRAVARTDQWVSDWPRGWYRSLMGAKLPGPVRHLDRAEAVDVHQLRAGHWSGSAQYLHRIGRNPSRHCPQCEDVDCQGARCPLCRETADTPYHVLVECPALMGARLRLTGTIRPNREDV